jgi:hypothetical protein
MPRWISEDGNRVFFDTPEPLIAQDTNRQQDVYEWEREESGSGGGSCPQQIPPRASGGCVFLLSGGSSSYPSLLVDADATGDNVFFETRGQLVPRDHNDNLKLYDARIGGGFPETSLACTGTGCQGVPPAPPIFATPSSATFNGVGNFPPPTPLKAKPKSKLAKCAKGYLKKKNKCVKKPKKSRSKKAKKASNKRRAKR